MNRRPLKPGDEDDHIGCSREEDEPRGLPRRGGCQEHSPMEVEERLLDNHTWTWNEKPLHHIPPKRVQNMHGVWLTCHGS